MNKLHYFMVGMPSAGKTSFVVRLCSQLLMNEGTLMYRLSDGELPEGYEYIKGQLDTMQGLQNIMRTFESTYYDMVLPLTNEQGEKISLEMPDLSGEYYRKLVEERYIDKKIYDELQQADVILFFLNPETMEREERIKCEETSAIRMVDEDMDIENVPGSEVRITEPRKATETQVVELLQILLYIVKKKMCIKFVISAWDRVDKKQEGNPIIPEEYLKVKFPLFYQYIISNAERMVYEIFGVSAQGAEYADEEEMEKLEEEDIDVDTLVKIVMPDGTTHQDLSRLLGK